MTLIATALPEQEIRTVRRDQPAVADKPPEPGYEVSKDYRLERLIHAGTYWWIFEASSQRDGSPVVLKFPQFRLAAKYASQLNGEWQTVRLLERRLPKRGLARSPNLVFYQEVFTFRVAGVDVPCLVMDPVPGRSLRTRLKEFSQKPEKAFQIAADILSALGTLHRCGIVHRDVKPDNILVADDGHATLIDLDSAQDIEVQTTPVELSSERFTAPEVGGQLQGRPTGPRSDLYSFGHLLYEMFTGGERQFSHFAYEPLGGKGHLPFLLDDIIRNCCEQDPRNRFGAFPEGEAELTAHVVERLRVARGEFERLRDAGRQDAAGSAKALERNFLRLNERYTLLEASRLVERREVLSELRQAADALCMVRSLDDEREQIARWEQQWTEDARTEARRRHAALVAEGEWEGLRDWCRREGEWLEAEERQELVAAAELAEAGALLEGAEYEAAHERLMDLVERGTPSVRLQARELVTRLNREKSSQAESHVGAVLEASGQRLMARSWPTSGKLYFGRGGIDSRHHPNPAEREKWGHFVLRFREPMDAAQRQTNLAISRRHLVLEWLGGRWRAQNTSDHMPVRIAGVDIAARSSAEVPSLAGSLEFLVVKKFGTPPERILDLRVRQLDAGHDGHPPSLLIEAPAEGIAAGQRWLVVGRSVASGEVLPALQGLFDLQAEGRDLKLVPRQAGRTDGHEAVVGRGRPLAPGHAWEWGGVRLATGAAPEGQETFLED